MTRSAAPRARWRIRVEGTVQGVGFRPFVYGLATELHLAGHVGNDAGGVLIEAEGAPEALDELVAAVRTRAPALAVVERVTTSELPTAGEQGFTIATSAAEGSVRTLVPPDTATCADCLAELFDPTDRRYRFPFVNCTRCGPRFTIVTGMPYDRAATTMAGFPLCPECSREYHDPADRRFHAEPTCCPVCGPRLTLLRDGRDLGGDPVREAAALLAAGAVVAVKGLGGYHLAVDATDPAAVARLRARKHRPEKPFALMVADLAAAAELGEVDPAAAALLGDRAAPIVLLPRRQGAPVADAVAPGSPELGVMLAYTPLHHLLARELARPLVLTSGNVSDEPIAYRDADALSRLAGIADAFVVSDRAIHTRAEDSVVRAGPTGAVPVRRSRGFVPGPLLLPVAARRPVLGCGAELKSTVCVARGDQAILSPHLGDLSSVEALRSYAESVTTLSALLGVAPVLVAHDLHPEYLSTKYAQELDGVELLGVQHHHAHIAACLADNGEAGPVVGLALDGTGFGTDATVWGGEVLVCDLLGFRRAGHLTAVRMPGGEAAIRHPWRMAASYLDLLYGDQLPAHLELPRRHGQRWGQVVALARSGVASPLSSSAGRLFDAVAAVLGLRDSVSYEAQAAIELEARAHGDPSAAEARVEDGGDAGGGIVVHGEDLLAAAVEDLRDGTEVGLAAARFHRGLAAALARAAELAADRAGLDTVALSGGVFQNLLLTEELTGLLAGHGLRVLRHRQVPPGDGGVSLGQAAVAAARDASARDASAPAEQGTGLRDAPQARARDDRASRDPGR